MPDWIYVNEDYYKNDAHDGMSACSNSNGMSVIGSIRCDMECAPAVPCAHRSAHFDEMQCMLCMCM